MTFNHWFLALEYSRLIPRSWRVLFDVTVVSCPGLSPRELLCAGDEFPGSVEICSLFSPSRCLRPTMAGESVVIKAWADDIGLRSVRRMRRG